jgi:hypothetical protein
VKEELVVGAQPSARGAPPRPLSLTCRGRGRVPCRASEDELRIVMSWASVWLRPNTIFGFRPKTLLWLTF